MNKWRAEYDDGIWRFYRDGMELGLYEKGDVVIDALNNAESRIAELKEELNRRIAMPKDLWFKVAELSARVNELELAQRWIPVSERLPETDGQYIGYTNTGLVGTHWLVDGHFVVTYSCEQNWLTTPTSWILKSASGGDVYVTHWMPLPKFPEVQE